MSNRIGMATLSCFLMTLIACSSGGGKQSAQEEPFTVEIFPKTLNFVAQSSQVSNIMSVGAEGKGDPGVSQIYVDAQVDRDFLEVDSVVQDGNQVIFNIEVLKEAWGGTYTGNFVFSVCADSMCRRHLADSPYTVPYTIEVERSHIRYEPISATEGQINEFSSEHLVISAESGVQAGPIRYRLEMDEHLGNLTFPAEMLAVFEISDISESGFTLNPPSVSDGGHLYSYKLGLSGFPETELPLNIYYFVGRDGGVEDQIIFMQDPVVIDVLYGQRHNVGHIEPAATVDYIATGIDRNLLDGMQFTISYNGDATGWMRVSENWREGKLEFYMTTENLEVGTYTASVAVIKPHHQISGTIDVVVNVSDGILLQELYPFEASSESSYTITHQVGVSNTRNRAGTWRAETDISWIDLVDSTGEFSQPAEGRYVTFDINLSAVASLPNNQISEGFIRVTADDDSFPPTEVKIGIKKRLPEITSMSLTQVNAAEAFTVMVTGKNLDMAHSMPVGLREAGSEYLEETMFSTDLESLTSTEMTLHHPGILTPGTYEVVFENDVNWRYGYSIPLVPRTTITVVD